MQLYIIYNLKTIRKQNYKLVLSNIQCQWSVTHSIFIVHNNNNNIMQSCNNSKIVLLHIFK